MRHYLILLLLLFAVFTLHAKQHFATPYSERVYVTQITKAFADEVNREIGLNIVFHSGESLYKHNEIYRALRTNQIQLGEIFIARLSNHAAIYQLDNLPFLATNFSSAQQLANQQAVELRSQFAEHGLHLLFTNPWPPQGLFTSKAIKTANDLSGLKVRSYSAMTAKLANHLKMIPTAVSSAEIAQAFATGMIEAMITSPATGVSSRAWQFSRYYTPINAWIPKNMVLMNHALYQSLTPTQKQKLKQVVNKYQQRAWQQAEQQTTQMTKLLADNGMIISPVSDSLSQSLKIVGANMEQEWALNATQSELHVLQKFKEQQNAQ